MRPAKFCYVVAAACLLSGLYLALPPFFSGPIDDWSYAGLVSRPAKLIIAALLIGLLPAAWHALTWVLTRHIFAVLAAVLVAILAFAWLVAPGLMRARMSSDGGFSTGGAKDIQLFRQGIKSNYLPREDDISYEGLFYDYYFNTLDTGAGEGPASEHAALFRPTYSWARRSDPLGGDVETFLAVGLRSDLDTATIRRKRLNLCVVLDISGSMGGSISSYYYDSVGERDSRAIEADSDRALTKLQLAARSIVAMLDHLQPDDRFGVVLFDNAPYVAKGLRRVGDTDMEAIKRHILDLGPGGGTSMEAGLEAGRRLLDGVEGSDPEQVENRIIFLTDAMPNIGRADEGDLAALAGQYARDRVHCTFLGMGIDFQAELIDRITKVRGANYYSVHSAWEFKKRLDAEFDYMVTPWAFDLTLSLRADGYRIDAVYGSPEADQATGELMRVSTLFPAPMNENAVKGGIILLKLLPGTDAGDLQLSARYVDRSNRPHETSATVTAPPPGEILGNADVRKAVLLARHVRLMKEWIREERARVGDGSNPARSPWERGSSSLRVSEDMKERMRVFERHFRAEAREIGDADLEREGQLLDLLIKR